MQLAAQQHPQFLCPGIVRKFIVPAPGDEEMPQWVHKYMSCTWRRTSTSLLEFLRKAGTDGQVAQRYRRMHKCSKSTTPLHQWINEYPADGQILVATIMNTRTNDRHYGQWLLLNTPFRSLEDLDHADAARLPRSLRYLGLCVLHHPRFWRNPDRIRLELEQEARTEMYIQNILSMIAARVELVDAYLSGELSVMEEPEPQLHPTIATPSGKLQLAPEQAAVVDTLTRRVDRAVEAKWPNDADVDAWGVWLDRQHAQFANVVSVVLGPAGSGKSTAVEIAMRRAIEKGAHVGIACPTGMLATRYKSRHPDLDVDTVHGMFALFKEEASTLEMMKIYDMIVIDEVGQLPTWIFDRLLRLWDAADRRPALVFVGDFCQLRGVDGTTAKDSLRWPQMHIMQLRQMRRCKCERLRWKLQLLRSATPSDKQLKKILKGHRAPMTNAQGRSKPTKEEVAATLRETPQTTFLTYTRRGSALLNEFAVQALFADAEPLGQIPCEPDDNPDNFRENGKAQVDARPCWMTIYEGLRVRITRNEDKEHGFVNGMAATVQHMRNSGVQVLTDMGEVLLIHPITEDVVMTDGSSRRVTTFPLRLGYSTTLHKVQGATLSHVTVWLDKKKVRAAMYVALSRVEHDRDWRFLGSVSTEHCWPAEL